MISDYLYGRHKIENMTIGTFDKLFPNAKVDFFGEGPGMDTDTERMSLEYERRILALERKIFELEKQLDGKQGDPSTPDRKSLNGVLS